MRNLETTEPAPVIKITHSQTNYYRGKKGQNFFYIYAQLANYYTDKGETASGNEKEERTIQY